MFGRKTFKSTAAVVKEIHGSFNIAGERLLAEARKIIASTEIKGIDRAHLLKSIGFTSSPELLKVEEEVKFLKMNQQTVKALEYLMQTYPTHKFITPDQVTEICKKYGLEVAGVDRYIGHVPTKNLQEIEKFFEVKSELNWWYYREYGSSNKHEIDKSTYDYWQDHYRKAGINLSRHEECEGRRSLLIAAPVKELNLDRTRKQGVFNVEIPDPVILCPIKLHGIQLYTIVTAWGPEASDELVVNQKMN